MQFHLSAPASLLAASLLAVPIWAADSGLLSLAMPDARVMAGINLEQARLSPLGQYLMTDIVNQETALQPLIEATGFDPRKDLREILLSAPGGVNDRSGLIAARGTFDVSRIVQAALSLGQKAALYKGVEILGRDPMGTECMAFLDGTLAIAGSGADIRAAIDRRSANSVIDAGLASRVNELSASQDAWFVTLVAPVQLQQLGASLSKVQQASGGVKLGTAVVVTAQTLSQTDKDAAALAETLKMLAGMVQMNAPKGMAAQLPAVLQNLTVAAEGQLTTLSLSVPEQQIEQIIKSSRLTGLHKGAAVQQ